MRRVADDERVWRRQAVLTWNGFYYSGRDLSGCDSRALMELFIVAQCPAPIDDQGYTVIKEDRWRDWDSILCALEIVGEGYKTLGWVETDPKQVVRRDLQGGGEVGMLGQKAWVEEAEEAWWDEVEAMNEEMDRDFEENESDDDSSDESCL